MKRVMRTLLLLSLTAALTTLASAAPGCGSEDSGNGGVRDANAVVMKDIKFDPQEIVVDAGTTVTWTNEDPVDHTVTADDGSFDSGNLGEGDSFSHTFDEPGTYEYKCTLHPPNMTGTVIVE